MSKLSLNKTPTWVWWSLFPGFGGLAISYAGYKAKTSSWIAIGAGITLGALALSSTSLSIPIWVAQIVVALSLKKLYLIKTHPHGTPIPKNAEMAATIASLRGKVEINSCSKHDLVHVLGLPIVYANDIDSLRNEGYMFTHLEELHEIVDIPESYLHRLAPLIVFSYHSRLENEFSWKRLNLLSSQELVEWGLEPAVAQTIVAERQRKGEYKSLMDVKRRTGLPFHSYRAIA
jgi:DNA uptake protein ComE-like DNA-binding protein